MFFYVNEYSLCGQFETISDFIRCELRDVVSCIQIIAENNAIFTKMSELYKARITKDHAFMDLSSQMLNAADEKVMLQKALELVHDMQNWDDGEIKQDLGGLYYWKENDVSATSMAEAAANGGALFSFSRDGLIDECVEITNGTKSFKVISVHHDYYLVNQFMSSMNISRNKVLRIRYRDTRLNFSQIEEKYGPDKLEKVEFNVLLKTFDKFIEHESFNTIAKDDGLEYKKYSPEQAERDAFRSHRYDNMTIMKFRYSGKQRVFGYRREDIFYVLRLERDHKISDYG